MKTNFRSLTSSFLLLLTCYACNKTFEEQMVLEESQSHGITTIKAQFDEFPELGELYRKTVTDQARLSKMGQKSSYDFQIDSTNVVKKSFENDDYYTFGLIGENDFWPYFENLVIANKEGQEPEAYLFRYSPDDSYLERFQEDPKASFSGTIEAEPLDYERLMSSAGGCITYTTELCNYGGHEENGLGEGVAGPGCQDTYIVNNTVCFIGPNPFDGGGGGSGDSGNGSGGGGSSNDSDLPLADSDVITKVLVTHEQLHQLNSDLGFLYASPQAYWVRDPANKYEVNRLINFVEANKVNGQIPVEVSGFGKAAVQAWMAGGEVDFEDRIIMDSTFVGTKAECTLNVLLKQTGYFKNVMDAFTNNNSKYQIKFEIKPISGQNHGAEAYTAPPDNNGIITIRLNPSLLSSNALEITGVLLHEGVHAQLHRVLASGNKVEYNMSTRDYNWLIELNEWWNDKSNIPESTAQHDFMSVRYVTPIANSVRKFDGYAHPLQNYLYFGWEGLYDEGNNRGLITMNEFNNLLNLAQTPLNDNHNTSCD